MCAFAPSLSFAVLVKMPKAGILNSRLNEAGLIDFAKETQIAQDLGNKELEALGVAMKIATASADYAQKVQKNTPQPYANILLTQFKMMHNDIYKVILQDSPEALKELADAKLYQSDK